MRIIPAIDIIEGKCVRLSKGDYNTSKTYSESPVDLAKNFEQNGFQYLHLVDLDGAKSSKIVNHKVLYDIAHQTNLTIDFGGGIKSETDVKIAFESGAKQLTVGSIAATNKTLVLEWLKHYGSEKFILGADCNQRKIATHGWLQQSDLDVIDFILSYQSCGIATTICTDIAKDGMLQGPAFELYNDIIQKTKMNLIASGGISSMQDVIRLKEEGCYGAIIGKAIYENKISLKDLAALC